MKIVLLRHGKPLLPFLEKMKGSEFSDWVNSYNVASLDASVPPSSEALMVSKNCTKAICSTLTRSVESSEKLGLADIVEVSSGFVEASLPSYNVLNLKLPHSFWLVLFRLLWLLGFSPNCESYSQAKVRAKKCSDKLILTAQANESVIFVGHGILNRLISRELIRRGWQGPTKTRNGYWQFSIYENEE